MALKDAYNTSGKIFAAVSQRFQPGLYDQLQAIEKGEITVVRGQYDHVEKLLETLKVPYEIIDRNKLEDSPQTRVLLVNCATYDSVPAKTTKYVKDFVHGGGRLVTTDWAVGLLNKVFPGKLTFTGKTGDEVVEVLPSTELGQKLIGLNYAQCHHQWWLDG